MHTGSEHLQTMGGFLIADAMNGNESSVWLVFMPWSFSSSDLPCSQATVQNFKQSAVEYCYNIITKHVTD